MRTIFSFLVASVDGYYEGPNQEFDWPVIDDEFNEFSTAQLATVDTLLFGRVTYQGMADYWTSPAAHADDPEAAAHMNTIAKIVVSRTLDKPEWTNTRLLRDDVVAELTRLKHQPGKDIAILGSSNLTVSLIPHGLVDELRLMLHPIALGAGQSLLHTADQRIPLTLLETRPFASGNVLLRYRPTT